MYPRVLCRRLGLLVFVLFLLSAALVQASQIGGMIGASKARKHSSAQAAAPPGSEAPKPQLLNADSNPTLHYPVSVRESSVTCGWLDVTRTGVKYTVVESGRRGRAAYGKKFLESPGQYLVAPSAAAGDEGFEVTSSEITNVRLIKNNLQIAFAKRAPFVIYLPQDYWETVTGKPRAFEQYAEKYAISVGTIAIQRAMQNFDVVLAEIQPPVVDVSLRVDPPSVEKGRPVNLAWNSKNATSLDLEPGVGRVAAAGIMSQIPLNSTNYTLTATGPTGSKAVSAFVTVTAPAQAAPPTLVLIEPSVSGDAQTLSVASSPLVIRGAVMDASGIPVVTVNGKSVTMRPTSAQAAEFQSDPIDLHPGENRFEVSAVNTSKAQAKVSFVARFTPPPPKPQPVESTNSKGLAKDEILNLLHGNVPSARVAELVQQRGVKFAPTPDDLEEIRGAGGGDDLIDAIRHAATPAKD